MARHLKAIGAGIAFAVALVPGVSLAAGAPSTTGLPASDAHVAYVGHTVLSDSATFAKDAAPDAAIPSDWMSSSAAGVQVEIVLQDAPPQDSSAEAAEPSEDRAPKHHTGPFKDGVYKSAGKGGKFGDVQVTVTIKDGKITSIRLGAHSESGAMAKKAQETVVPQIIDAQSTEDIDTATGATLTSEAIIDGVDRALDRASR